MQEQSESQNADMNWDLTSPDFRIATGRTLFVRLFDSK